jgi:membrane protein
MKRLKEVWELLKQTVAAWSGDNVSIQAAALAYYTFFSLPPLLIVIINIAGILFGAEAVHSSVMGQLQGLMGQGGTRMLEDMIAKAQKPETGTISTVISVVTLVVGAVAVFTQLQTSLNIIWHAPQKVATGIWGFLRQYILSFGILLGAGFLLIVSLVVSAVVNGMSGYLAGIAPGMDILWKAGDILVSFVIIGVLFALIFKVLPNVKIVWRDVWVGSAVTAALTVIGKFLIGLYLGRANLGANYGAAASLVIILLWIYYTAQLLFFGAEFTRTYADRYGSQKPLPGK